MEVPLTVVSLVVVELLVIQVDDVGAHVVQEALVVGNDEKCLLPALKIAARTHTHTRRLFSSATIAGEGDYTQHKIILLLMSNDEASEMIVTC